MSPPTVAVVGFLTHAAGISLAASAVVSLLIGLPGFVRAIRDIRGLPVSGVRWDTAVGIALPIAWIAGSWILHPAFRAIHWHTLMYSDVSYALTRPGLFPEETEMAGLRSGYSWWPNIFWAAIGMVSGLPPTMLVIVSGIVFVAAATILIGETGRMIGGGPRGAWLACGLCFFATNVVGMVLAKYFHTGIGAIKYTPLLGKYTGLDAMPYGFALVAAVSLLAVGGNRGHVKRAGPALFALNVGLGIIYPLLLPATAAVLLAWFVHFRQGKLLGWDGAGILARIKVVGPGLAGILLSAPFIWLVMSGRGGSGISMAKPDDIGYRLQAALFALGPVLLLSCLACACGNREAVLMTLAGTIATAPYILLGMKRLEYKYILAGTILYAPPAAAGLRLLLRDGARVRKHAYWALPAVLAIGTFWLDFSRGYQIPHNLNEAPRIVETSFQVALDSVDPDAGWVESIRNGTSNSTVVVSQSDRCHTATFLNRSLFAPSDLPKRPGYTIDTRENLVDLFGHPAAELERRAQIVTNLYAGSDDARSQALDAIRALRRPIAIHLRLPDNDGLSRWLGGAKIGQPIYHQADNEVWLIQPTG